MEERRHEPRSGFPLLLLTLFVWLAASPSAVAQNIDGRLIDNALSPHSLIGVQTSRTLRHLELHGVLGFGYVNDPLVGQRGATQLKLIGERMMLEVGLLLGVIDRLELGLAMPIYLRQRSSGDVSTGKSVGTGMLRFVSKATILANERYYGFGLGAYLDLSFPTGKRNARMGETMVHGTPGLILDFRRAYWVVSLNLGYRFRRIVRSEGLVFDDEVRLGLGVEVPLYRDIVTLIGETTAAIQVGPGVPSGDLQSRIPVEVLAALRWRSRTGFLLTVGAGLGATHGLTASDFQVLISIGYGGPLVGRRRSYTTPGPTLVRRTPGPTTPGPTTPGPTTPGPTTPTRPGLVPPPFVAKRPLTLVKLDQLTQTDDDFDGDGIPLSRDKCPNEPEDFDGFEDEDGCPDLDNDRDGIPDLVDKCPNEPETINGFQDEDGCPDVGKGPRVIISGNQIVIKDRVYFDTGSDALKPQSNSILDQVAQVLRANPQMLRVLVEGHTDNQGDLEMNVDLSQRRAQTVMAYLIGKGVPRSRLRAKGFGPKIPVADNGTREGRAKNRRVAFKILELYRTQVAARAQAGTDADAGSTTTSEVTDHAEVTDGADERRCAMRAPRTTDIFVIAATLALLVAPRVASAKLREYTVKRGDTCWNIAARFFGDPKHYEIIHKYNRLGPLPHILKVGSVLRLPLSTNTADAQIEWLDRTVKAKSPTNVDWFNARPKMNLWRLYKVSTGSGSTAGIRFEDDALLKMRAGTLVVIYGGVGGKTRSERLQKRSIVLEQGTLRGGLSEFYKQAGLKVKTPSSEVLIKSRDTQVEVDKKLRSIISVFDGEALVKAKNTVIKVLKDYGTVVEKDKKPEKPRPLPKAPKWVARVREVVLIAPAPHSSELVARWQPVGTAARYRVELANNKRFRQPIVDAVVGKGVTRMKVEKLPPGTYYARVATVGGRRLHSRPSKLLRVRVLALKSSRMLRKVGSGRYEVSGLVQLFPPSAGGLVVSLDGSTARPFRSPLRLYQPGAHRIDVRDARGGETTSFSVQVRPVSGQIRLAAPRVLEGRTAELMVELADDAGHAALLPELRLAAYPGGPLPLELVAPGRFRSRLVAPPRSTTSAVVIRLSWAGGDLVDQRLEIDARRTPRPAAPKPKSAPDYWPEQPALVNWGQQAYAYHLRAARVIPQVGLGLNVLLYRTSDGKSKPMIANSLQTELGFLDNRLGLDAHLSWLNLLPDRETLGRNKVGDLTFGLRYVVWRTDSMALTPRLGFEIPLSDFERLRRDYLIEPGLTFEWRQSRYFALNVDVGLVVGFNRESQVPLLLVAGLGVNSRPWRYISLAADVRTQLGFVGPSDLKGRRALFVTGAIRFPFGRYRIGVYGESGIGTHAKNSFGVFTIGLTFDVALGGF